MVACLLPFILAILFCTPFLIIQAKSEFERKERKLLAEITYSSMLEVRAELQNLINQSAIISGLISAKDISASNNFIATVTDIALRLSENSGMIYGVWSVFNPSEAKVSYNHDTNVVSKMGKSLYYVSAILDNENNSFIHRNQENLTNLNLTWFERIIESKKILVVHFFDPIRKLPSVSVVFPIYAAEGNVVGAFGMDVDFQSLKEYISMDYEGINYGVIFQRDGTVAVSTKISEIGNNLLNDLRFRDEFSTKLQGMQKGREIYHDEFGDLVSLSVINLSTGDDYFMLLRKPIDIFNVKVLASSITFVSVMAACLILGLAISVVVSSNIAVPIVEMTKALGDIADGKTDVKVPESESDDEIGRLARIAQVFKDSVEELVVAKKNAEVASQSKTEFLANMSHEFRTPLHAILSYAKLGLDHTTPETKDAKYYNAINIAGKRLLRMVNSLLDYSKLETGKADMNLINQDIVDCISAVGNELTPLLKDKKLALKVKKVTADSIVMYDFDKMFQVFVNLISNAIKYSPVGNRIEITIMDAKDNEFEAGIKISVRDHGIGIPEQDLESIFDIFTQSSSNRSGVGGTGLGLSIVKRIVTQHCGDVWAENAEDGGAIVSFIIPRVYLLHIYKRKGAH